MRKMNEYVAAITTDFTWYDSSNILYSECVDNEGDEKTLYIVYKKGGDVYRYDGVNVFDYLFIRDAASQGKECHARLKPYKYERVGKVDVAEIERAYETRINASCCLYANGDTTVITDGRRETLAEIPSEHSGSVEKVLESLGVAYHKQNIVSGR